MKRPTRPRTDQDRARRNRNDLRRAIKGRDDAREKIDSRRESVEIERIFQQLRWEGILALQRSDLATPKIRKMVDMMVDDYRTSFKDDDAFHFEAQIRAEKKDIRPGQVWTSRGEEIRVLDLLTDSGGDGGFFPVLVEYIGEEGFPFAIDAARIRMDWHLVSEGSMVGQLELFSCR